MLHDIRVRMLRSLPVHYLRSGPYGWCRPRQTRGAHRYASHTRPQREMTRAEQAGWRAMRGA